jgi:transposase InsO family protein
LAHRSFLIVALYHPQTNGKIERYHRTLKGKISLLPDDVPGEMEEALHSFVERYNYQRYHEGLGNVTPHDVYTGKHLETILARKGAKSRTPGERRDYNKAVREQGSGL